MSSYCHICKENSYDYTRSWSRKHKDCPYLQSQKSKEVVKTIPKPCEVCKIGPSDFVTRCGHFFHKTGCTILGQKRYCRCPVCDIPISRWQEKEMIFTRKPWEMDDLKILCPLPLLKIVVLACQYPRLYKKIPFTSVINYMKEDSSFNINHRPYRKHTLLEFACENFNAGAIKDLLKLGAKFDYLDYDFYLSYLICAKNNLELLNILIDKGFNVLNAINQNPVYYLYYLDSDNPVLFERLIEIGFDPKGRFEKNNITLLMIAADRTYLCKAAVKLIENSKNDLNAKSNENFTVLYYAIKGNNVELIEILIQKGVNIDGHVWENYSAFQLACSCQSFKAAKLFYELQKPDINSLDPEKITPLAYSIKFNNIDFFNHLLSKGADINQISVDGSTNLDFAIKNGNFEIIKTLINQGCSLNVLCAGAKRLPIHELAENYVGRRLKKLIKLGADVNGRDEKGDTVLHYACRNLNYNLVKALVKNYRADVNAKNNSGKRPIDYANTNDPIKSLLLERGSKQPES